MLSSTAGFSFLNRLCVACDVPTGESDLVTVSCGRSQRPVLHDLAVNSMSLALALTISFDAFRDFVHGMRKCQWPLSVTSVPLEAVCFVICSASDRLRGTDVSDHQLFTEALLTVVRIMSVSLSTEEVFRNARSPWQRRNGVQLCLPCA